MRLLALFMLLGLCSVHAVTHGQEARIDLSMSDVSLSDVFQRIEQLTDYMFVYKSEDVLRAGKVNVNVRQTMVKDILTDCLRNTGLEYIFKDNVIVIQRGDKNNLDEEKRNVTIRGKVFDNQNLPLPGVTVRLKGTSVGTTTDAHGKYVLTLPQMEKVFIIFSFIGMETQEVEYTGQDSLNIVMKEDVELLDEVVVHTGYQKINKRYLSSAVTSLKMDDIKVPGVSTVDQLLQGRIPGMIFMQNSGQVGAAPKLRIRGTSTILGNQEPLWVVDGIIQTDPVNVDPQQLNDLDFVNLLGNAISGLNPDDIEQIDVLKDASATALYGTRAANGVIVITTKKGRTGPPRLSYSVTGTLTRRPYYSDKAINMMNSKERIDVSREMIERKMHYSNVTNWVGYEKAYLDFSRGSISFEDYQKQVSYYETLNTDWFDVICRNAFSHNHTLSLSGGSNEVKYYFSLGYMDEQSALRGESNKRYSSTLNISANYNKLYLQFALSGSSNKRAYNPSDLNLMTYAYTTSRAIPLRNEDGSYYFYEKANTESYLNGFNVVNEMNNSDENLVTNAFNLKANMVYKLSDCLQMDALFSYSVSNTNQETWYGEDSYYINALRGDRTVSTDLAPLGGEIRKTDTRNDSYTGRLQFNFDHKLDENALHMLSLGAGFEFSSTKYETYGITNRGYSKERGKSFLEIDSQYIGYYSWLRTSGRGSITESLSNKIGLYGTLTYIYNNDYVLNLSVRADATNNFGERSNFLPIWAVSFLWNVKDELLENVHQIDVLSLKSSFGYQGNMLETESPNLIIEHGDLSLVYDEYMSSVVNFPNPYLKYEKKLNTNFALDFSLWNRLINGSISFFYNKTTDAFLSKRVSTINGITDYVVNEGNIENTGTELVLNFTPFNNWNGTVDKRGFTWRFDPQFGQVVNQLISKAIDNRNETFEDEITWSELLAGSVNFTNKPLGTFYSYKFQGLNSEDGTPMFYGTDQEEHESVYDEASDNKEVYFMVMEESGTRIPVLQGGISNYFGYRNFSLSMNFTYSFGNKIRLLKMTSSYASQTPVPQDNMRKEFVKRWRKPGDEKYTNIPSIVVDRGSIMQSGANVLVPWWSGKSYAFADNVYQMYDNSDLRVVDGRYLRLQSLVFQYRFDDNVCKKLGISSAYLGLSGTNLFTWTVKELRGQDPEQSGTSDMINLSVRPTYSLSLNISF